MTLIIVESPTKAKTLSRFLGKDYQIEATKGHIKDLPKSKLGVDLDNGFKPDYIVVEKRASEIATLIKAAAKAKEIYLASDPDREGEAIASHVKEIITEENKKKKSLIKRIVFHEITKEAVDEAIAHPRDVDTSLVDAQTARRVLDRLVGYKLSPLLWQKVRRGLSAGRVQSVVVRLIVEKEREIEKFKSEEYWEIFVEVAKKSKEKFTVQLTKVAGKKASIGNGKEAEKIVSDLKSGKYKVLDLQRREVVKRPHPPFTTSTMTQSAARVMGWSAKKTMSVAQGLYEEGLITYHRTDSTNIAVSALDKVRKYIGSEYGKAYLPDSPRIYKVNTKVAQEAHEAIRPTDPTLKEKEVEAKKFREDGKKLYSLIWKRFVASQMNPAIFDETSITVESGKYELRASGQIIKFDGWRKLFPKDEENVVTLPEVIKGEDLNLVKVDPQQKFTQPPARFNEASLIKTLEKLGIGRPSTYAPTISTIQARSYVEKQEGKFLPTPIGIAVNDFLIGNFPDIFEYTFTAGMEDSLDKVADGKSKWAKVIKDFWSPFSKKLSGVQKTSKRVKIETEKTGEKCPECKEGDLVIRIGRFGKFISCERFPECKYTAKYIEKIDMKCPKCGKGDVIVKFTAKRRKFFGCSAYPECDWASWKSPVVNKAVTQEDSNSINQ